MARRHLLVIAASLLLAAPASASTGESALWLNADAAARSALMAAEAETAVQTVTASVHHARIAPRVEGVPVQDSEYLLHFGDDGQLVGTTGERRTPAQLRGAWRIGRASAVRSAIAFAGAHALRAPVTARRVIAVDVRAWEVTVPSARPLRDVRVTLGAQDGALLALRGMGLGVDGEGLVFDPDPLLAGATAGNADADSPELTAGLVSRILSGLDGSGFLRGRFADVTGSVRALEPSQLFAYHRDDPRFEQVMAYRVTAEVGERFAALGLDTGSPVRVEADAIADDNSFYSPATRTIMLGTGGVEDGEDASVIAHEYGHALQGAIAPGYPIGQEATSVAEGFGDYVAGAHLERVTGSAERAQCLFAWDVSLEGIRCARTIGIDATFPRDVIGEPHEDGRIWSGVLWGLRETIGPDATDTLALSAFAYVTPRGGFQEIAAGLLHADRDIFGGVHAAAIASALGSHGLVARGLTGSGVKGGRAVAVTAQLGRLVRIKQAAIHGGVLKLKLRASARAAVRVTLRTKGGRAIATWRRTLPVGIRSLALQLPQGARAASLRVLVEAGPAGGALATVSSELLAVG